MFTGKTSHVGGEKEQKEHKLAEDSADGLKKKFHDFKVGATHLKHRVGKFQNLINSNHRHDEEHEKETDAKRTKIGESHRFQSFAPERDGNKIKWYIDGRDYFHAVSVALERATETIYIEDWWLSPELFLRRPPAANQKWRLDQTLKRAAERGVKIYVVVYREVEQALTCNSQHTKKALHELCPEGTPGYGNIRVMRHPDHNVLENAADMTFYWAHHEKFIVIDYNMAFIGGLDLCFGRWDNHQHVLADAHPAGVDKEIFPGQDWNNNRIMDFQSVQDWKSNEVSKADYGRMPWHDVAMGVIGPCIYDIAEHFVLRWNFVKREKYKRDDRYDWLTLTGRTGENEDLVGVQRPKHPVGEYIHHPLTPLENKYANPKRGKAAQHPHTDGNEATHGVASRDNPDDGFEEDHREKDEHGYYTDQHRRGHGLGKELKERGINLPHRKSHQGPDLDEEANHQQNSQVTGNDPKKEGTISASGGVHEKRKGYPSERVEQGVVEIDGTVHAQLVRSSADWSSGILAEQSIQNAYCQVIRDAKHFVYIENQFFITATGENQSPIHNQIGAAIVDACVRAAKENRKFRVIIIMPAIPGFAGDLRDSAAMGTRAIMDYQYKSICRGDHSIYGRIKAAGFDPTNYIFVFNLRSYDRLNKTPALQRQEEKSGVTYQEVQRAQAEEVMSDAVHGSESFEGGGNAGVRETAKEGGFKGLFKKTRRTSIDYSKGGKIEPEDPNDDPKVLQEKKQKFEAEKEVEQEAEHSSDSIAKGAMLDQKKPSEEPYIGRDENGKRVGTEDQDEEDRQQELENFVQEELYIHGKLLIVDDRIAICGSSNINDRSQLGFHDSELSIVMEDTTPLKSIMDGQEFTAGHHAATLRRMLWREHLGLLPPQPMDASEDPNAQPPGDADNYWYSGDEYDQFVEDPLNDELWKTWTKRATINTAVFRHIFHADPDDNVKSFEDYDKFLGAKGSRKEGHVYDMFQPVDVARQELDKIQGHLVWFPLKFLEDASMAETGIQVNSFTESVYT